MASLDEIRAERIEKLNSLLKKGKNPYPARADYDVTIEEALKDFSKLAKRKKPVTLVGRVLSQRKQGGLIFFHFDDGRGRMQGLLKKDESEGDSFKLFDETVDIADFVLCTGSLFTTKRGEKTLLVKEWKMAGKALRSLPDKWHGLTDVEERFRKRYLDILMTKEVRDRFVRRAQIIKEIRAFLDKKGFMEVETPALQPLYGGATAEPFVTHHNTLDMKLYLRVSDELYLKRLLIGGFPKVYELSKDFRNEGIDTTHYPEFTMLEWYEAFSDAKKQMALVGEFFKTLVKKIFKKEFISYDGEEIDFSGKFRIISYYDVLKRYALIVSPESTSREELMLKAKQLAVPLVGTESDVKILDAIYKKVCRPKMIQPTFIVDYPVDYLPLAKRKDGNEKLADAFQLVVGGIEMVKAFSELNDPEEQRERFRRQKDFENAGDKESQKLDIDFLEALEYGMPPAGGVGIGIDRLVMLLTDTHNIKEVILFPGMRRKEE